MGSEGLRSGHILCSVAVQVDLVWQVGPYFLPAAMSVQRPLSRPPAFITAGRK